MWRYIKQILQVIKSMTAMLISTLHRTVSESTTKCSFLFSAYHITKLQPSDKNTSTHIHENFESLREVTWKAFFRCSSPYRSVQKGNQAMLQNRGQNLTYMITCLWRYSKLQISFIWTGCLASWQKAFFFKTHTM